MEIEIDEKTNKINKKKILAVIIVILIAIIVAVSVYFVIYTKKKNSYDKIKLELSESKIELKYGEELDLEDFVTEYAGGKLKIVDNVNVEKLGEYKVIYRVVADEGVEKSKELIITIVDDVAPVITIDNDNITLNIDEKINLLDGIDALDNYDEDIIDNIVITGEVDIKTPGTYEVRYDLKDSSGNEAETKIRTYIVSDVPSLEIGKTYEYSNSNGGASYTLKENNEVEASAWATNGGGSEYKGIYRIENNKIIIKLTEMNDYTAWVKIEEEEKTYTITNNNQFESEDGKVYKIKA